MVLDVTSLNTQHYKVWIKGKWNYPEKGVVPSATPCCSSYWKESFWVFLNYGRPTYICIYIIKICILYLRVLFIFQLKFLDKNGDKINMRDKHKFYLSSLISLSINSVIYLFFKTLMLCFPQLNFWIIWKMLLKTWQESGSI